MSEDLTEPGYPSSPVSYGSLFHHETWQEQWTSPKFPLDESLSTRERRFEHKAWWDAHHYNIKLFQMYAYGDRS
jgi:hypothetical protein